MRGGEQRLFSAVASRRSAAAAVASAAVTAVAVHRLKMNYEEIITLRSVWDLISAAATARGSEIRRRE